MDEKGPASHRMRMRNFAVPMILATLLAGQSAFGLGRARKPPPSPEAPAHRPDPTLPEHGRFVLRLMTYNVASIPFPTLDGKARMEQIGELIRKRRAEGSSPHLVAFQEVFTLSAFNMIHICGYPYIRLGPDGAGIRQNAGLAVLSEFPFRVSRGTVYTECGGVDCLARKGALFVRVRVPGLPVPLELIDTHLNSSYSHVYPGRTDGTLIRSRQIRQLKSFTRRHHRRGFPFFALGDFNTIPGRADFNLLKEILPPFKNAVEVCVETQSCSGDSSARDGKYLRSSLDHQYYTVTGAELPYRIRVRPIHVETTYFERDLSKGRLSDHSALEVHYLIEW